MQFDELKQLYALPFFDLIQRSRKVHEAQWPQNEVQLCTLLSIKTGGCSEDCSYCAQSARYTTSVAAEKLMEKEDILERARQARENGSTRFCMGAAWKGVKDGTKRFEQVIEIVESVSELGMEVCTTLGELGPVEAAKLKAAGVTAYNHNIDTSPEHYTNIVSTHSFQDRLNTLRHVQDAGMSVCSGGILGLGETTDDRIKMLEILSNFNPQPESVPINSLVPIPGTPLAESQGVDSFEVVRMIALARIAIPQAKVRLSAGRKQMSEELQTLCFFAGANSIFYGDKLLTTGNPQSQADLALLKKLGLEPQKPNRAMSAPDSEDSRPLAPALA
ncbi:MAG: biotin synthase BioB [Verrucomicrobiales bacterium]|nr:biotin synthase BioB [Verrucomicrobiales bacterium]